MRASRLAIGVASAALVAGLIWIPATPGEPGFEDRTQHPPVTKEIKHTGPHDHAKLLAILDSQNDIDSILQSLAARCGTEGWAAEVWVEQNEDFELEAWGRCTMTYRQGP